MWEFEEGVGRKINRHKSMALISISVGIFNWRVHYFTFLRGTCLTACRILVPQTEIEPVPSAMEAQSFNPWTAKEFPAATAAKSLQSCPTLCDPIDGSPPGSPVPGILQTRTLKWVVISFSNAWKWKAKVKSLSRVRLVWVFLKSNRV